MHFLDEVNNALSQGQYFFSNIKRAGIALYELPGHPLTAEGACAVASKYFEEELPYPKCHWALFNKAPEDKQYRHAAFELHQATEHTYAALLLVLTTYSPSTHNVKFLHFLEESKALS